MLCEAFIRPITTEPAALRMLHQKGRTLNQLFRLEKEQSKGSWKTDPSPMRMGFTQCSMNDEPNTHMLKAPLALCKSFPFHTLFLFQTPTDFLREHSLPTRCSLPGHSEDSKTRSEILLHRKNKESLPGASLCALKNVSRACNESREPITTV